MPILSHYSMLSLALSFSAAKIVCGFDFSSSHRISRWWWNVCHRSAVPFSLHFHTLTHFFLSSTEKSGSCVSNFIVLMLRSFFERKKKCIDCVHAVPRCVQPKPNRLLFSVWTAAADAVVVGRAVKSCYFCMTLLRQFSFTVFSFFSSFDYSKWPL